MRLDALAPGDAFFVPALGLESGGQVIGHGPMGSRVKWGKSKQVRRIETAAGAVAEFESPGKPEMISSATEVTPIK